MEELEIEKETRENERRLIIVSLIIQLRFWMHYYNSAEGLHTGLADYHMNTSNDIIEWAAQEFFGEDWREYT